MKEKQSVKTVWNKARRAAVLCAFCCLLGGCAAPQKPTKEEARLSQGVQQPYNAVIDLNYQGLAAQATIDQSTPGCYQVKFTAPETVAGMEFETDSETIIIRFGELETSMKVDEFFDSAAVKALVSGLNSAAAGSGVEFSMEDQSLRMEGDSGSGRFLLRIDRENGNLLSLEMPQQGLSLSFKDFCFLSGPVPAASQTGESAQ